MQRSPGQSRPLGVDIQGETANFALFSHHAENVHVGIFDEQDILIEEIPLQRTGDTWHIAITPFPPQGSYAFRVFGPQGAGFCYRPDLWLADPFARAIKSPKKWGEPSLDNRSVLSWIAPQKREFDWQGISPPKIAKRNLIIYEMHVRGLTRSLSSGVKNGGTYQGVIEKIPHFQRLGINAVELMPIFEFDELHVDKNQTCNYWGYNPLHFFTPMRRFAAQSDLPFGPIDELKEMIRELHKNGIEVILDGVFNHTGEGKDLNYLIHLRGIDHPIYYMLDAHAHLKNYSGCGNVLNANHPDVSEYLLASLRYWVEEFHIDGFRFDLAAILTRGTDGKPMSHPPFLNAIHADPLLSKVKLIAEVWDAAGLYLSGQFAQAGWSEWNGRYRDSVRRFLKGNEHESGNFARSLCGSDFLFKESKTPLSSINFITAHDGFTLRDLVSYNQKHNLSNGENNQDGSNQNDSWNCGIEGITEDPLICELRERQMRNFLLALFISQGIPMLLMRDEYGHSCNGNNNPYVHDSELNWYAWNTREDIVDFVASLIAFRKSSDLLRKDRFLTDADIQWHGHLPGKADFTPHSHFVSFTLLGTISLHVAFNADRLAASVQLPKGTWRAIVQTEKKWDDQGFEKEIILPEHIEMAPYSALLAIQC